MSFLEPVPSRGISTLPQRCLPWSSLASLRRIARKPQHQQTRNMLDIYRQLDASRSNRFLTKPDLPWRFAIYRCSYKDESAWNHLVQYMEKYIKVVLECNERMDLLPHHQLVINDDMAKFNRATSHEVRDHFNAWVAD